MSHVTARRMCERGELKGAKRIGSWWRIPATALEPYVGHGKA